MRTGTTWDQLGPRSEQLEQRPLTPENVEDWLPTRSELEKDVEEQVVALQHVKDEDTRDRATEDAYLTFRICVETLDYQLDTLAQAAHPFKAALTTALL